MRLSPRLPLAVFAAGLALTAAAAESARPLTVRDAIDAAIHNNVDVLISAAGRDEAAGRQGQARSALLPQLSADVSQSRQKVNLAAQGIQFPGLPNTVTYDSFDARLKLRQSLIDISAWQRYAGAESTTEVAAARERVAREQVAARAAINYVETLRARQTVTAARADLDLAQSLAQLARDRHDAGVASGVDVARAETALSQRRVRLAQARTDADRAQIQLARTAGLPLGQPLVLDSGLDLPHPPPPATDAAIDEALHNRPEMQLAGYRLDAANHRLSAARDERLPSLALSGAYGRAGNTPDRNREETYRVAAEVEMPIFSGGAINGRVDEAAGQLDQARLQQRDTREQIEQDVRLALRNLDTSAQRLAAARDNRDLAERELTLSRNRFSAGVTNNIEVINAQASLAEARSGLVAALAQYASARVNLDAALGRAQSIDF